MDINEFMRQSLETQQLLLQEIKTLNGLVARAGGGTVVQGHDEMVVRIPAETARDLAEAAAHDTAKAIATAGGSTKQAANHARDDAKQEAEAAAAGPKKRTADDVRTALMKLGKVQGSQAAVTLLQEHGSTSVSGLTPEQYEGVIKAAEAAVAEAGA